VKEEKKSLLEPTKDGDFIDEIGEDENDDSDIQQDVQEEIEVKKFIQLKENVSWLNAFNIFFTYFVGISQIVFFDLTLVYLLKSEHYFDIDERKISRLAADVVFYSQPFTLVFDIIIGYMHDKLGRRITCFLTTLV
jgi:hypothetical protein